MGASMVLINIFMEKFEASLVCCEPTDDERYDEHGRRADGRRRGLRHVLILRDQPADLYGQLEEANDPEEQADADAAAEQDGQPAAQGAKDKAAQKDKAAAAQGDRSQTNTQ